MRRGAAKTYEAFNSLFEMRRLWQAVSGGNISHTFNSLFEMRHAEGQKAGCTEGAAFNSLFEMRRRWRDVCPRATAPCFQFSV